MGTGFRVSALHLQEHNETRFGEGKGDLPRKKEGA